MKVRFKGDAQGFGNMIKALSVSMNKPVGEVLKSEVNAVLISTINRTRVAKPSKIKKKYKAMLTWAKTDFTDKSTGIKLHRNLLKQSTDVDSAGATEEAPPRKGDIITTRQGKRFDATWKLSNQVYANLKQLNAAKRKTLASMKLLMRTKLQAAGLFGRTWYEVKNKGGLTDNAGIKSPAIPRANFKGRFFTNGAITRVGVWGLGRLRNLGYKIVFTDKKAIEHADAASAFWWSLKGRTNYFNKNMKMGVFNCVEQIKRAYKLK